MKIVNYHIFGCVNAYKIIVTTTDFLNVYQVVCANGKGINKSLRVIPRHINCFSVVVGRRVGFMASKSSQIDKHGANMTQNGNQKLPTWNQRTSTSVPKGDVQKGSVQGCQPAFRYLAQIAFFFGFMLNNYRFGSLNRCQNSSMDNSNTSSDQNDENHHLPYFWMCKCI